MSAHKNEETVVEKDVLLQAQSIWQKNKKTIIIALTALIVIVGGWYSYINLIVKPKEEKAQEVIYKAEEYFRKDSFNLALNGDGIAKGFLYIEKNYSGTKAANLSKYYAGVCYLQTGEFQKAIDQLKDFSTSAKQIQTSAYGILGDAYSELKKNDEAIEYYKKAGSNFEEDAAASAEYLFRAAALSKVNGKTQQALELYKTIKEKFPKVDNGRSDKYIYQLSIEKNDLSIN
ncbi:MAG: tetratricopeptide repeat protein [Bacteroidetes bacterium]|nr:tetratricopeptide repeat protein [Bacteroidota bacterium]MBS1650010.1 tetratricopeptide repeat protein [Bacteroidota bacterium]